MGRSSHYETTRSRDRAIEDKLQVLRDFCIVDRGNEEEYRKVLLNAILKEPDTHFDIILDRVAKKLIGEKMYMSER